MGSLTHLEMVRIESDYRGLKEAVLQYNPRSEIVIDNSDNPGFLQSASGDLRAYLKQAELMEKEHPESLKLFPEPVSSTAKGFLGEIDALIEKEASRRKGDPLQ